MTWWLGVRAAFAGAVVLALLALIFLVWGARRPAERGRRGDDSAERTS